LTASVLIRAKAAPCSGRSAAIIDNLSQIRRDFGREHELGYDSPLRGVASSPDKTLTRAHAIRRLVELGLKAKK
jgi:hypothetical protein